MSLVSFLMALIADVKAWANKKVVNLPIAIRELPYDKKSELFIALKAVFAPTALPKFFLNWNRTTGQVRVYKLGSEFTPRELKGIFGMLDLDRIEAVDMIDGLQAQVYVFPQVVLNSETAYDVFGNWVGQNVLGFEASPESYAPQTIPQFNKLAAQVRQTLNLPVADFPAAEFPIPATVRRAGIEEREPVHTA